MKDQRLVRVAGEKYLQSFPKMAMKMMQRYIRLAGIDESGATERWKNDSAEFYIKFYTRERAALRW